MSYAASVIKLIQRGTISHTSAASSWTATITAVDTDKAVVLYGGNRTEMGDRDKADVTIYLTNATTVTVQTASTPDDSNGRTSFQVVEFY